MKKAPDRLYKFTVQDGKVHMPSVNTFLQELKTLKNGNYAIAVKRMRRAKTLSQNNYYWAAIVPVIAEHVGYDPYEHEQLHRGLMEKFLGEERFGLIFTPSFGDLSLEATTEYINQVIRWGQTELGLHFQTPDEYYASSYIDNLVG